MILIARALSPPRSTIADRRAASAGFRHRQHKELQADPGPVWSGVGLLLLWAECYSAFACCCCSCTGSGTRRKPSMRLVQYLLNGE
jgi:hypothetical protein